jgi:hypothetical protein
MLQEAKKGNARRKLTAFPAPPHGNVPIAFKSELRHSRVGAKSLKESQKSCWYINAAFSSNYFTYPTIPLWEAKAGLLFIAISLRRGF